MDYLCGACGSSNVVEVRAYGDAAPIYRACADCGSDHVLGHDATPSYKRSQPASVGQMLHRQRKAESALPPSPMEQRLLAALNDEAAKDLVVLLEELAETG